MPNRRSNRRKKDDKTYKPYTTAEKQELEPKDIDKCISDMKADDVGIELKKFIVYTMERMVYGPDHSDDFIVFCMSSYFILGERKYKALAMMYNLPSIDSIRDQAYGDFKINVGISDKLLKLIRIKTENLISERKICLMEMDEIHLEEELEFNENLRCDIGYEDDGELKTKNLAKFATHIWVHSIGGAWMMPVCFIFTRANSTPEQIRSLLFRCIEKLEGIGLDIVGLVTKMRVNLHEFMTQLGVTPEKPTFRVGSKDIVFLFEVPQLMNVTRNMMMKYKFKFDEYQTSWKHVKSLYANECLLEKNLRKTKLGVNHVKPGIEERVLPLYAIQTLSNSVATEMRSQVTAGKLPARAAGTAECIDLLNKLFDMFNSTDETSTNEYKCGFKGTKDQLKFCAKVMSFFKNLRVINSEGTDCTGEVKFINGWLITIMGMLKIWDIIKDKGHPYLLTRNICCDVLDKFLTFLSMPVFGADVKPTPPKFLEMYTQFLISAFFTNEDLLDEDEEFLINEFSKKIYRRVPAIKHDIGDDESNAESSVDPELNLRFGNLMKEIIWSNEN